MARTPRIDELRGATKEELAMTAVPSAPGASAVVLEWVQRQDDIDMNESEYMRIKILSEDGKKYGDIEIPYITLLSSLDRIEARTTQPDGTVVPFNGKTYEKLIVKTGGVRLIAKTFSLPDVRPGSVIEYRYDISFRGNYLRNTRFTVQRELPVLREMLWLRPYRQQFHSLFTYRGLPDGKKPVVTGDHYELMLENIPPFDKEMYSAPAGELKPAVNFYYTVGKVDPETFWLKYGQELTATVEEFIGGDVAPIHSAAQEAIAGAKTPEEKLRNIYAVTQKIRNLGYEKDKTAAEERRLRENRSAQDVLRNGYGGSHEINRLFIALARSAGFEANAVTVASRDDAFFSKVLPIASQLDGEVAMVKVAGKELVLDPGTPNAPFGTVAWQKGHVPGMKLARKQDPVWVETPQLDAKDALVTRKADLHVDGDALKGTVTITYRGQEALVRRLANYNDDEAATKKSLEGSMKRYFPEGATVSLKKVTGMKSGDAEIVAEYDVELPNTGSFAGSRAMIPLSVFHVSGKNPFAPAERKSAVYFEYPSLEEEEITLAVPSGYGVETMPNPAEINAGAIVYVNRCEHKGAALHYTRRMLIDSMYFPREQYSGLRAVFSKITAADQEQVVLRKAAAK
jgi:hypothetical protein